MLFFLTFCSSKNATVSTKIAQLLSTLIQISVSCALHQHIKMISEGSCDTEDWSNFNSAWPSHGINTLKNIVIYKTGVAHQIINCDNIGTLDKYEQRRL